MQSSRAVACRLLLAAAAAGRKDPSVKLLGYQGLYWDQDQDWGWSVLFPLLFSSFTFLSPLPTCLGVDIVRECLR